ncbi:hypothetical protein AB0I94_21485 [Streptomyces sp. NPDC050147]|uniref:hypothetical protein n=1 Tax=Streptomyces sp. NPDC050147 TaxID=3155513 RepID=UPI003432836A
MSSSSCRSSLSSAWIDAWISRVQGSLDVYISAFESRFGYPPDSNSLEAEEGFGAAGYDETSAGPGPALPVDLALLHRHVRDVSLPDVGVGLFAHSAQVTVAGLRGELPTRVVGGGRAPAVDEPVVVFGSDGGGSLFALSRADGATVYRLPPGRVERGVYHCAAKPQVLAENLLGFLTYVEDELRRA